jgi:hypothetical protein
MIAEQSSFNDKPFLGAIEFYMNLEDSFGDANALVGTPVAARLKEIIVSNPGFNLAH